MNRLAWDITDLLDQRYPMQLTCREIADTLQNGATPRQIYNCIYNMPQEIRYQFDVTTGERAFLPNRYRFHYRI